MLMELALIDHHAGSRPDISHTLRESNKWADQLTHRDFEGFDMTLRFDPEKGALAHLPQARQELQP